MIKHIPENAEVACRYPHLDMGTLERSVRFDVHTDRLGVSLDLDRRIDTGVHQSIHMRFQYALFAEILAGLAEKVVDMAAADREHRAALRDAAEALSCALRAQLNGEGATSQKDGIEDLTPEQEVLLLHVLE
jgi:hypothetical protein